MCGPLIVTKHSLHKISGYPPRLYYILAKTTATQNEDALSYYKTRGLYFLVVGFVRSIYSYHFSLNVN